MPTLVYHSTKECPDKKQTSPTYLVKDTSDCSMLWLTTKRNQPNPTFNLKRRRTSALTTIEYI
eukprot:scaffold13345_cov209-Alexandrium_tamarense.AAC.20